MSLNVLHVLKVFTFFGFLAWLFSDDHIRCLSVEHRDRRGAGRVREKRGEKRGEIVPGNAGDKTRNLVTMGTSNLETKTIKTCSR